MIPGRHGAMARIHQSHHERNHKVSPLLPLPKALNLPDSARSFQAPSHARFTKLPQLSRTAIALSAISQH
jgi:hypothetical protein